MPLDDALASHALFARHTFQDEDRPVSRRSVAAQNDESFKRLQAMMGGVGR